MIFNPLPNPITTTTDTISLGIHNVYSVEPSYPAISFYVSVPPIGNNGTIAPPFTPADNGGYTASTIVTTKTITISRWVLYSGIGVLIYLGLLCHTSTDDGNTPPPPSFVPSYLPTYNYVGELIIYEWRPYISTNSNSGLTPATTSRIYALTIEYFRTTSIATAYSLKNLLKPQIKDYFVGYSLDPQPYKINLDVTVLPSKNGNIKCHYYQLTGEAVKDCDGVDHPVVDILTKELECIQNQALQIKLDCVPCSISLEGDNQLCNNIKSQIILPRCFPEDLPAVKSYWISLYNAEKILLLSGLNVISNVELLITPYVWAASQRWGNSIISDLNTGLGIGETIIDASIQDKYFSIQLDGTYGSYVMPDSARLKEIHAALNASQYLLETPADIGTGTINNPQTPATHKLDWYIKNSAGEKVTAIWKALGGNKYSTNQLDNTKERVTNLGFLVERIAKVLGIRFDDNGKIEVEKEKATVRKVIDKSKDVDPEKVGINGFGDGGMVVKRINNRFKKKGEIVSDQCVVVQDMPDLIQEYFEQANLALGIQESSAIEIKQDGTAARFNSQLEILVELVNLIDLLQKY
jgi:hypothetical protein